MVKRVRIVCVRTWVPVPIGQTNDYKTGICGFSTENAGFRNKTKD